MGLLEHPSCSYADRRPGAHGLRRKSFLQQMIIQQADKHGKYVQWNPSTELALASCAEVEVIAASKVRMSRGVLSSPSFLLLQILSAVLTLRDQFQFKFPDLDSLCIFPAILKAPGEVRS